MSETVQIPKGWELKTLEDVCEPSKYGYTSKSHKEKRGIPYIRITDLNENGTTLKPGRVYVDINDDKLKKYKLKKGDILIARTADVGKSFLFNEDETMVFASYLIRFRPKQEIIEPKFLLYILKSNYFWIHIGLKKTTTAVSNVNAGNLSKFEFALPPLSIQKQIVAKLDHILGELEVKKKEILSLIEQNKERIDIFEKNWMSYVIDEEIEKHPQREKWELKKFHEISEKITDGEHFRPQTQNSGIPFLSAKDILEDGPNFKNCLYVSESDSKKFRNRCNPEKNDVLMVSRGATIGRTCINNHDKIFCLLGSVILIKLNPKISPNYILNILKSNLIKKQLLELSGSSAQQAIYLRNLKTLEIVLPPLEIQKQIVQNIKSVEQKFQIQKKQFEMIKNNYDSKINYINHIQSSILDSVFSGKLIQ